MVDRKTQQQIAKSYDDMSPDELREAVKKLAKERIEQGDDARKEEDALFILSNRPKVEVTTYYPRTDRTEVRKQDRKVWTAGIIDPLAYDDNPDHSQVTKVVDLQTMEVLFSRDAVLVATPAAHRQMGSVQPDWKQIIERLQVLEQENERLRAERETPADPTKPVEDLTPAGSRGRSRAQ